MLQQKRVSAIILSFMVSSIFFQLYGVTYATPESYATPEPRANESALNNANLSFFNGRSIQGNLSSIEVFPILMDAIKSQTRISLEDAIANARENVGPNSTTIDASLRQEGGFLAYKIRIIDSRDNLNTVTIDPSNGNITLLEKDPEWMSSSLIMGFP